MSSCNHATPMCSDCWLAIQLEREPGRIDPLLSRKVADVLATAQQGAA